MSKNNNSNIDLTINNVDEYNVLVSVVVAVYNIEKYIARCLNSVINQTYKNIEIIVVDDGSTDESLKICERLRANEPRIKIISQENQGLSAVRNVGIKNSSGKYIYMIDGDDYLLENLLESQIAIGEKYGADIIIFDYYTNHINRTLEELIIKEINSIDALKSVLIDSITSQVWNKIFRKELLNNIYFPEKMVAQDIGVMHLIFSKASKVISNNLKQYVYFANRPDNISNTNKTNVKGSLHRAIHFYHRYQFADMNFPDLSTKLHSLSFHFFASSYIKSKINNDLQSELIIKEYISKNIEYIGKNKKISYLDRLILHSVYYNRKTLIKIIVCLYKISRNKRIF